MCGIFGYSGTAPDATKIRILGIHNDTRGGNGCGLFIDGLVYRSTNPPKWVDWIKTVRLPKPEKNNVVFGHCRKATVGAINEKNTHPFVIRHKETNRVILVGMHNGTVSNWEELCEKHPDIAQNEIEVDSVGLLSLIAHSPKNDYSILEEYVGAAALAWTYGGKPNTLFLYHGKSKRYSSSTTEDEERPLFYWDTAWELKGDELVNTGNNGIYFSSIKESLVAIGALENEVMELPFNEVFSITNGIMKSVTKIDRSKASQNAPATSRTAYNYGYDGGYESVNYRGIVGTNNTSSKHVPNPMILADLISANTLPDLLFNDIQEEDKNYGKIYFSQGLYWRGGFPAHSRYAVYDFSNNNTGPVFIDIPFYVQKDGEVAMIQEGIDKKIPPRYFYRGYLCKDFASYQELCKDVEKYKEVRMFRNCYAKRTHPRSFVFFAESEAMHTPRTIMIYNNPIRLQEESRISDVCNGPFEPLFSKNTYFFNRGVLETIVEKEYYNEETVAPITAVEPSQENVQNNDEEDTFVEDFNTLAETIQEHIEEFISDHFDLFVEGNAGEHEDDVIRTIVIQKIIEEILNPVTQQ